MRFAAPIICLLITLVVGLTLANYSQSYHKYKAESVTLKAKLDSCQYGLTTRHSTPPRYKWGTRADTLADPAATELQSDSNGMPVDTIFRGEGGAGGLVGRRG